MTGELTVVGEVLPIGGVREKVLAAKNFGLSHVLLPKGNEPEVQELKPELTKGLTFHFASTFDEVAAVAFAKQGKATSQKPVQKPAKKPEPQPVQKPQSKRVAAPATKPATVPVPKPATKPATRPAR